MKALYTASTGMAAQERNVEIISNNIANMRTTGYKRQRADFQDLLYQVHRRAGSETSSAGTQLPTGVEVGSGVKTGATPRIMSQGNVAPTEKELDIAIRGEGFFSISLPDGRTGYTRDGSFERDLPPIRRLSPRLSIQRTFPNSLHSPSPTPRNKHSQTHSS